MRVSLRRRFGPALAAVLLVAGTLSVASPALAAGCSGGGCTGKDPEAQGCGNDATTVDSFVGHYQNNLGSDVYLELRQSRACNARWVRVKSGSSQWGCGGGSQPMIRVLSLSPSDRVISTQVKNFSACGPFPQYSAMVGHSENAKKTDYGFVEAGYGWCSDTYYHPCKTFGWPQN